MMFFEIGYNKLRKSYMMRTSNSSNNLSLAQLKPLRGGIHRQKNFKIAIIKFGYILFNVYELIGVYVP